MYINKAIVVGNIVRDPELKSLPSGQKVCSFSVATNRTWKDAQGQKQEAAEGCKKRHIPDQNCRH